MYHQLIGRKSKELLTHIKNGVLVTSRWLSFNGCARRIQIGHPFFGQSDILERKNTLLIIWYITCLKQGDNSRSNRRLLAILFCRFVGEPWCSFSLDLFPTWMVGQTQTPNSSSLRTRFRLDWKGLVKSSGLKCTEHIEEVFPGVQCLRVSFTNFIHRCLLRRTSGLRSLSEGILCMLIPFSTFRELLHPKTTHFSTIFSVYNWSITANLRIFLHDVLFLRHAPYLDTFGRVGD